MKFLKSTGVALLVLANSAFASSFTISNNASDILISVKEDTLCTAPGFDIEPISPRFTSDFEQNPILAGESKTVSWGYCAIVEQRFFEGRRDHSKIYVTLTDYKTGKAYGPVMVQVQQGMQRLEIFAFGKKYLLAWRNKGDYSYTPQLFSVTSTETVLSIEND